MKKIIALLLILMIIIASTGCSSSPSEPASSEDNNSENQDVNNTDNQDNDQNNQQEDGATNGDNDNADYDETDDDLYTYELDTEYSIDLNNDGQDEKIVYSIEDYVVYMTINGNEFELSERCSDLTYYRFRTVDIDPGDFYEEVILREADPLAGDVLNFYRYDGKDFYCVGSILISYLNENNEEITLDGCGKITAQNSSNIMQDGIYNKDYIINENENLEEILPEEIYTYIRPITSKVNKEIRGYEGKTIDESYETILVGEEIVIYGEIDNWLKIKWNDKELWVNDDELTHYDPNFPDVKFEFDGIQFWS